MAESRRLTIEVLGDAKNALKALGDVSDRASRLGSDFVDFGKKAAAGFAAITAGAVVIGKQFVDAASDLNEVTSKTNVIFGDAAEAVLDFASKADAAFGQSQKAALEGATTFGTFGKAAGLTGDDLAGFSTDLVGLASDLASFSNTTPEEAIEALGAALRGESEPIRRYGVMLDDAALKAKAMELGIYDGNGSLTQQQKILAAQAAIFEQTSDAQGDFARTSDGLANQQRILAARFENTKARLGQALLPIALKVANAFSDLIDRVAPLAERLLPKLADILQAAADKAMEMGRAVADFLQPYIEKIGNWMRENTDVVKVFMATLAGVAAIAAIVALGAAFASLFNPITLIVGAIATLAAGFYYAYTRSDEFRAVVDAVVKFFTGTVVPAFQAAFGAIADGIRSFVDGFRSRMDDIRGALDNIRTFITTILGVIKAAWDQWGDELVGLIKGTFDGIKTTIESVLTIIKGVIDFFLGVLSGDWSRAWDGIRNIVTGVLGAIWGAIQAATAPIVAAFKVITDSIGLALSGLWDIVTHVFGAIERLAYGVFGRIASFIQTVFEGVVGVIKSAINGVLWVVEAGINLAIDAMNQIIYTMEWTNGTASYPRVPRLSIPRLAEGGIVTGPTLALIGEAGPEAVIPLSGPRAQGISGSNVTVHVAGSVISERDLVAFIRDALVTEQRRGKQLIVS